MAVTNSTGPGNNNTVAIYHFCQCGKVDSKTSACTTNEWRDLCVDPGYLTSASSRAGGCFTAMFVVVATSFLS